MLELDPDVHVVLCTAYPEQGWRQRVEALPGRERVLVLKKPFDVVEVQQLASALCERWSHGQRDRARLHDLERSVSEQRDELARAPPSSERFNHHLRDLLKKDERTDKRVSPMYGRPVQRHRHRHPPANTAACHVAECLSDAIVIERGGAGGVLFGTPPRVDRGVLSKSPSKPSLGSGLAVKPEGGQSERYLNGGPLWRQW